MKKNIYKIISVVFVVFIIYYIFKPLPSVGKIPEQKITTVIENNNSKVSVEKIADNTVEDDSDLDIYEIDDFRLAEQLEKMINEASSDEGTAKTIAYFIDERTGVDCSVDDIVRCEPEYKTDCFNEYHKNKDELKCITFRKLCQGQEPSNQSLEFARETVENYFKNEKLVKAKFKEYVKKNFIHNCAVIRHNEQKKEQKIVECEVLFSDYCEPDKEVIKTTEATFHCMAVSHVCIHDA